MFNHFATQEENLRFEGFEDHLIARGRSASTLRAYRSDWQDLSLFARRQHKRPFDGVIRAELISHWCDYASRHGKRAATINRRLAFARVYAGFLAHRGVISAGQAEAVRGLKRRRSTRQVARLSGEEIHQLLAQVDARGCSRDQAIIYTLLDTGLRAAELVALDVGDVDFEGGRLCPAASVPRPIPTRTARKIAWSLGERGLLTLPESGEIELPASGGWPPEGRLAPPPPERLPRARSPMPLTGGEGAVSAWPLFVGERGRLSENAVQRLVRTHGAFARIKVTPHALRNTFALHHYATHHDLVGLAELLGQSGLDSVRQLVRSGPVEADEALSA